jgi:hypothetical protein
MVDIETHERLQVNTEGDAGPYLMIPLEQLPDVRRVLTEHNISHTVVEDAIKLDDKPVIAILDFGRTADAAQIQAVLDAA